MGVCPFLLTHGIESYDEQHYTENAASEANSSLIAIWAAIFIVFRIIGWGVGEACDGTINCLI